MGRDPMHHPGIRRLAIVAGFVILALAGPANAQDRVADAVALNPTLKALRERMVAGSHLSFAEMRGLADAGDSLAALRYAKRLEALGDASVLDDAVHYYAMALYDGRDGAISPVVSLLDATRNVLPPARLRAIERSIQSSSRHGNRPATAALAQMYLKGSPFGPNRPEALRLLAELAEDGDAQAALDLSMLFLSEKAPDPEAREKVQTYLILASTSTDLSVRTMAENLMRQWPRQAIAPPARPEGVSE
jgi:TPR repeat protein